MIIQSVPDQYSPDARAGVDMRLYGWIFDYPDPSDLFSPALFSHDPYLNPFDFTSPHWAKANAQASRLTDPHDRPRTHASPRAYTNPKSHGSCSTTAHNQPSSPPA